MLRVGAQAVSDAYTRGRPMVRNTSRSLQMEDEESKARVRAYRFGDHLKQRQAGSGVLVVVPTGSRTEMDLVRGMLLRAVYGDEVDLEYVDYANVYVYLLPDVEEIKSPCE
jgi:hypothetical protein